MGCGRQQIGLRGASGGCAEELFEPDWQEADDEPVAQGSAPEANMALLGCYNGCVLHSWIRISCMYVCRRVIHLHICMRVWHTLCRVSKGHHLYVCHTLVFCVARLLPVSVCHDSLLIQPEKRAGGARAECHPRGVRP